THHHDPDDRQRAGGVAEHGARAHPPHREREDGSGYPDRGVVNEEPGDDHPNESTQCDPAHRPVRRHALPVHGCLPFPVGTVPKDSRPATNRAVTPGRTSTPSRESNRIAPTSESPTRGAPIPANGPRSTGQPWISAWSGSPSHVTASVSARGTAEIRAPPNRPARSATAPVP